MPRPEPLGLPAGAEPDLLREFVAECREYIAGAEAALLTLEAAPDDAEAVNTVFRAFHTIKGTAGFVGVERIAELAHHAESLLSRVRAGQVRFAGGYADLALEAIDGLKALLQAVERALDGGVGLLPAGYADLVRRLGEPAAPAAPAAVSEPYGKGRSAAGAATREASAGHAQNVRMVLRHPRYALRPSP